MHSTDILNAIKEKPITSAVYSLAGVLSSYVLVIVSKSLIERGMMNGLEKFVG